jgi:phage gpG-like protein
MGKPRVIDRDMGYRLALRRLQMIPEVAVSVGVHEDAPPSEDGVPVAEYAAINEFGSDDGHVPERSFLRSTLDEHQAKYAQMLEGKVDQALEGKHLKVGLREVGHEVVRDVRAKIESGVGPANAPSTIAKKGHGATLQDSGLLSDSITAKVEVVR